jgi:hypothetical protein
MPRLPDRSRTGKAAEVVVEGTRFCFYAKAEAQPGTSWGVGANMGNLPSATEPHE